MSYPSSTDTFRLVENLPGVVYDAANKKTLFVEDLTNTQSSIVAIETELGPTPSGASATVSARLDDIDAIIAAIKPALFPVGSIYTNAHDGTNPATLLGFGTWSAFGEGRVLVSKAASGTFGTYGATGGEETHSHGAGTYQANAEIFTTGGNLYIDAKRANTNNYVANTRNYVSGSAGTASNGETQGEGIVVGGASSTSSSLQPYIVVYMWRRSA